MIQIREGVFETNSSSTHAISVCCAKDYDDLITGKAMINVNLDILPRDEAEKFNDELRAKYKKTGYDEDDIEDIVQEDGYVEWCDLRGEYEYFENRSTIQGVDVVAFGYYGYDY